MNERDKFIAMLKRQNELYRVFTNHSPPEEQVEVCGVWFVFDVDGKFERIIA